MHTPLLAFALASLLLVSVASAEDTDSAAAQGAKITDKVKDTPRAKADEEEYTPPPGFKIKKRGKITVYCIKGQSTGTRFESESCFDKAQLQEYLLVREQNRAEFERSRAVCATSAVCAPE